jgi:hypothetical protein
LDALERREGEEAVKVSLPVPGSLLAVHDDLWLNSDSPSATFIQMNAGDLVLVIASPSFPKWWTTHYNDGRNEDGIMIYQPREGRAGWTCWPNDSLKLV